MNTRDVLAWPAARAAAAAALTALPPRVVALHEAHGAVLAGDAVARSDLPVADTSAMDGWAVAGPAPWRLVGRVLAGEAPSALAAATAVEIATGAVVPPGADVLRREWGWVDGDLLRPAPDVPSAAEAAKRGRDIRQAATECRAGDVVVPGGTMLRAVALGMLAAAGHDTVPVRRAGGDVLVLGDELLAAGPAHAGRLRDALGPLLSGWLPALGVEVSSLRRVPDTRDGLEEALAACRADVVVTTGSTARGPVDHLHVVLDGARAVLVVDGVAVRPGHPQLLAVLPDGRPVVGLPGNPLAAVSGILTLLEPVVAALTGRRAEPAGSCVLAVDVSAGTEATRLVPVRGGRPVLFTGPGMLRGLTMADEVAVIPPGGAVAGTTVEALRLP